MNEKASKNHRFSGHFFPSGKKAIQLSMNFLVVVILSIVMLSLGLVLVNNFFTGTVELSNELDAQTNAEISNLLSFGEITSLPFNKKTISINDAEVFGLGILNINKDFVKTFDIFVTQDEAFDKANDEIDFGEGEWLLYDNTLTLDPHEQKSIGILIKVPPTPAGTYIFDVNIEVDSTNYGYHKIIVIVP